MKRNRRGKIIFIKLFLRFCRVMFGEIAAAILIGLVINFSGSLELLTIRVVIFILSAGIYMFLDNIIYERPD